MQLDPFSARRRSDASHPEPIFRSLEDRLLFRQAQGTLAGLVDCGHVNAARSLRTTAAELDLDVAALAGRFLACLAEPSTDPAETLLLRIAVLALLPDGAGPGRGRGGGVVPPADQFAVGAGNADPAVELAVVPSAGGVSLHGVLDVATVPLLHTRTPPVSVASVLRSSNGEGFHLDIAGLTHLDDAGLRALDALATKVRDGGSTLRVTTPASPELGRLLDFAVSMRWLPVTFEVTSSASTRPPDGRTDRRPAGWTHAPGHDECLAELDALYDCYASACWSLARRLLGDDSHAEAVVQTAFLDAWQQLTSGTLPAGRAGARLLNRTHREAVHRLREARTGPRPPTGATPDAEWPGALDRRHGPRPLPSDPRAELSRLPEQQAGPLRLAFWNGLTVQEIAATTGVPLADVRANLLVGVRTLSRAGIHPPRDGDVGDQEADAR